MSSTMLTRVIDRWSIKMDTDDTDDTDDIH